MKKGTALDVKESTKYTVYSTQYTFLESVVSRW